MNLDLLKYPIGKYKAPVDIDKAVLETWIAIIENFPKALRATLDGWTEEQLSTPYRPEGWTVRQLVHHLADSHINSYVRFKLGVTEVEPTIKPYNEEYWAELPEAQTMPVKTSIQLLEGLHARWAETLKHFSTEDWKRKLVHPEHPRPLVLDKMLGLYAWHCEHHLAHIRGLQERSFDQ